MMEMIKKNWGKIVLTSAVVLAASLAGGYGWVMPVVMLAAHLLCLLSAFGDKIILTLRFRYRRLLGQIDAVKVNVFVHHKGSCVSFPFFILW